MEMLNLNSSPFLPYFNQIGGDVALSNNVVFQCVVLLSLALYLHCCLVFPRKEDVFSKTFKFSLSLEDLDPVVALNFRVYLMKIQLLQALTGGIFLYKLIGSYFLIESNIVALAIILGLSLIFPFLNLLQNILMSLSCSLSLRQDLANDVLYIRNLCISAGTMLLSPVVLLLSLYNGEMLYIFYFICVILSLFVVILLLYKTYLLFLLKKVSVFNWFLYLCGVEIFPVSILAVIVLKDTI